MKTTKNVFSRWTQKIRLNLAPIHFALITLISIAALLVTSVPAEATTTTTFTNPYSGSGYDVSYPQCSNTTPYPANEYAIIGIGDGRAFTTNPCVQGLWSRALMAGATSLSIYVNTGNSGAYGKDITTDCATGVPSSYTTRQEQQSWEIGCSEADYAFQAALNNGINPNAPSNMPSISAGMWWADIETGTSWSNNTSLNRAAIDGLMSELASPRNGAFSGEAGVAVGIYSNTSFWNSITGNSPSNPFTPTGSYADWWAGSTCNNTFDGLPEWIGQFATGTPSPVGDSDSSCP